MGSVSRAPKFMLLTYCTNIHPSNGWADVLASIQRYAPPLKAALSPDESFGIGLRLSGQESVELLQGDHLTAFKQYLDEAGLMVYTMNGFPYGPFHGEPVKDQVHAPDWRDPERVNYTIRLAKALALLLPEGLDGGISTNPLAYKPWFQGGVDDTDWTLMTHHVVDVVAELVRIHQQTGKLIHIDIEPEPDGVLETSAELVEYVEEWLLPVGGVLLATELGLDEDEATALLLEHVRVCWDTCHVAVMCEDPADVLARYQAVGLKVGKIQISSALKVYLSSDPTVRQATQTALLSFVESTYLHQVIQQNRDGSLMAYRDLDEALPHIFAPEATQWRIHFHVPIFIERYGAFDSTQDGIVETLRLFEQQPFTNHLEIETYTWGVLPPDLQKPLGESIRREFEWVQQTMAALR
ncbi:MAG: metabolite traffic protein EboE [Rhodothermales bacterium]